MAEGIAALLRARFDVLGICRNGREMVARAQSLLPDIVIFDIGMPELNGIEACRQLQQGNPTIRTLCLTQQIDLQYLLTTLDAGARAFVSKQSASGELLEAIDCVLRGKTFVTPLLRVAYEEAVRSRPITLARATANLLTPRQREVLQLIAEGKQGKEIASALNISAKTVEFHRGALMDTLGLRSAAQLTRYAIEHGIVQ